MFVVVAVGDVILVRGSVRLQVKSEGPITV